MQGDRAEIVMDAGCGTTQTFELTAARAGRRIEITERDGTLRVSEVTRTGREVHVLRFPSARVLAVIEHRHGDDEAQGQSQDEARHGASTGKGNTRAGKAAARRLPGRRRRGDGAADRISPGRGSGPRTRDADRRATRRPRRT